MRVLHVISGIDPGNGGPTFALLGLAAAQVRRGDFVSVAATYQKIAGLDNARTFEAAGVHVHMIGPARGRFSTHPAILPTLRKLVADHDVVHIHACFEQIQHDAALVCRRLNKPYVWRPCGLLLPWRVRKNRLFKKTYLALRLGFDLRHAAAIHYTTADEQSQTTGWLKRLPRAVIEPNGVDVDSHSSFGVTRADLDAEFPQLAGKRLILFLSRIAPEKGLDLLIPAFAMLDRSDVALLIVGADFQRESYRTEVEKMIDEHGVREKVTLAGERFGREKAVCLAGADVFALTSHSENFGNIVVEAVAAGLPTLITTAVGVAASIKDVESVRVVEPDVERIAQELANLIDDEALRDRAKAIGPAAMRSRFDWNEIAGRWRNHYQELAGGGGGGGGGMEDGGMPGPP